MKNKFLPCLAVTLLTAVGAGAQKFDTTVKMNAEGYHITAPNKNIDDNNVSIDAVKLNFSNSRTLSFPVKGRVTKAAIDDLNEDGQPDFVIFYYSGANGEIGNVVGAVYMKDEKSIKPVVLSDIYSDPKLREGYKGHDVFSLVIGTLLRKFPIYLPNDAPDKPTGGLRTVQYKAMPGEGPFLTFKVLRTFDTKPEDQQ